MIIIACTSCSFAMRVEASSEMEISGLVGDLSEFYPDKYPCPGEGCKEMARAFAPGEISLRAAEQLKIIEVTAPEAFAALYGLGLPKERSCYLDEVRAMFSVGVKKLAGKDLPGTTRCMIDHIELNDGTKVYLGASAEGATIYRVTRQVSYVENVEKTDE
jgi:hypothetical protein